MSNINQPDINIRFVSPVNTQPPRRRRPSRKVAGLRHDMSQFYPMKAVLEALFGGAMYARLKETASFRDWQEATARALDAIAMSIEATVQVADQDWRNELVHFIALGKDSVRTAASMDELFASLSATLIRISFTQIGKMPTRPINGNTRRLTPDLWCCNGFRSVQYVQTAAQREANAAKLAESRRAQR